MRLFFVNNHFKFVQETFVFLYLFRKVCIKIINPVCLMMNYSI